MARVRALTGRFRPGETQRRGGERRAGEMTGFLPRPRGELNRLAPERRCRCLRPRRAPRCTDRCTRKGGAGEPCGLDPGPSPGGDQPTPHHRPENSGLMRDRRGGTRRCPAGGAHEKPKLGGSPSQQREGPCRQSERERISARPRPGVAGGRGAAENDGQGNGGAPQEGGGGPRQAESDQGHAPQPTRQAPAPDLEPIDDLADLGPPRAAPFGHAIMRQPAFLLAQIVGDRSNQMFRPGNAGLGGRNRVERIAGTSSRCCSLI